MHVLLKLREREVSDRPREGEGGRALKGFGRTGRVGRCIVGGGGGGGGRHIYKKRRRSREVGTWGVSWEFTLG